MRVVLAILGAAAIAAIAVADGDKDRGDVAIGRQTFMKRCANCHFVPDPSIERDKAWLGLIKTTA